MRSISFAWTAPALLVGRKTVTRRDWSDAYARRFQAGDHVAAYDRSPRFGGKRVAVIELEHFPYQESTAVMPSEDWEREGFAYLASIGAKVDGVTPREFWEGWMDDAVTLWVVRFRLVSLGA